MILKLTAFALALGVAFTATDAGARPAKRQAVCVDRGVQFSFLGFFFGAQPAPQANGCAPAVYSGNEFVGQDPDINIRYQLNRDAQYEGYHLR